MSASAAKKALEINSVRDWLSEVSPALAKLSAWMDEQEDWVSDPDDEFLNLLALLVEKVEDPAFVLALEQGLSEPVAQIFAFISSSRFFRVFEMLERRSPGLASRLVFVLARLGGESKVFSDLFCERLLVVHHNELMDAIITPRRCSSIVRALRLVQEVGS